MRADGSPPIPGAAGTGGSAAASAAMNRVRLLGRRSRTPIGLVITLVVVALVAAAISMYVTLGNPFPPRTLVMATGPAGSGFQEAGLRYREVFAHAGVELRLVPSAGGFENLERLRDPAAGVGAAFVESGVTRRQESPELVSLGAVSVEPLWIFSRGLAGSSIAERLSGKRISTGAEGSGTRFVVRQLLALNGIPESAVQMSELAPDDSAAALVRGEIDVATMLTSWTAPAVRRLLLTDGVVLEGFPRAAAYVALFPSLEKVVLPQGVADLGRDIPRSDIPLIAVESNLLIHRELHPALQYLLLEAAAEIHGGHDVFHAAARYPAPGSIDLPLSDHALTFFRSGRPFLYRYLPLWLAGLAERLLIIVIPLFAVVFPVAHFGPLLFGVLTEHRIFGYYRELREVERALELPESAAELDQLDAALQAIERRTNHLWVPLSYTQRLFILKSHVALSREQIEKRRKEISNPGTPAPRERFLQHPPP